MKFKLISGMAMIAAVGCVFSASAQSDRVPGDVFDLSEWNMTVPIDENKDKKPDTITVKKIQTYSHPDFFYLDENDHLVFAAPNKAATTPNYGKC